MAGTEFVNTQALAKTNIDISKFVVGVTKVVVKSPEGCCNSTLCFYEPMVIDVGTFIGQNGEEKLIAILDNNMKVMAEDIAYAFC